MLRHQRHTQQNSASQTNEHEKETPQREINSHKNSQPREK